MDIGKELIDNNILLSVFSKDYYNESVLGAMKNLKDKKICYVTLNKTSDSLLNSFKYRNVKTDKMFFIDAVSQSIGKVKERENTLLVSSPSALTELSIAISESLKSGVFDIVFFDSLSTLNIYNLGNTTERFTSHVISKIKSEKKKGLFVCLDDDINSNLIKNSFMYVDGVLRFKDFYQALEQKKHAATFGVLAVAVAGLASMSFLNMGAGVGSKLTGFVIAQESAGSVNIFVFLILLLAVNIFLIYRSTFIQIVSQERLKHMKPEKKDSKKLEKHFKSKIKNWFEKTK